jgi:hypothetical protein
MLKLIMLKVERACGAFFILIPGQNKAKKKKKSKIGWL